MLLKHIPGLFVKPTEEWQKIQGEPCTILRCYISYAVILAAIGPIAGYIGTTQFGWQIGAGDPIKLTHDSALAMAAIYYFSMLVSIFVLGYMVQWMGSSYGLDISLLKGIQLAIYTATPIMLAGAAEIFPALWFNFLVGLPALAYTVYLLYVGVPILMDVPKDKAFLISSAIVAFGLVTLVCLLGGMAFLWDWGFYPIYVD